MAKVFSHSLNDRKAVAVADKIGKKFPNGNFDSAVVGPFVEYLATVGKLPFSEVTNMLEALYPLDNSPFSILRVSYAILHYSGKSNGFKFGVVSKVEAHAKILKVTVKDRMAKHPQISLTLLLVSSPYAGRIFIYSTSLPDMISLQKKIYTGRSKSLAARSLLELVGCTCTVKINGSLVEFISASSAEKKNNKELCQARIKMEGNCPHSTTCACCSKRRSECRLAIH